MKERERKEGRKDERKKERKEGRKEERKEERKKEKERKEGRKKERKKERKKQRVKRREKEKRNRNGRKIYEEAENEETVERREEILRPEKVSVRKNKLKKEKIIKEFNGRTFDLNVGGQTGKKINTAYRETCIKILCILEIEKKISTKKLVNDYGFDKSVYSVLYTNPLGYFLKTEERGLYTASEIGKNELNDVSNKKLVNYYRKSFRENFEVNYEKKSSSGKLENEFNK